MGIVPSGSTVALAEMVIAYEHCVVADMTSAPNDYSFIEQVGVELIFTDYPGTFYNSDGDMLEAHREAHGGY